MNKIVKCEVELSSGAKGYESLEDLYVLLSDKIEEAFSEYYGVHLDDVIAYNIEVLNHSCNKQ